MSETSSIHPPAPAAHPEPVRFIRMAEVVARTGRSRSTLHRDVAAGTFPASIALGANSVAWIEAEVTTWQQARIAARDAKAVAA